MKVKNEKLTIERLRTFKGLEQTSNDEAAHIVDTLNQFAAIIVENLLNSNANENE